MKNKEYQSITKMIEYIERAELYTRGMTFKEFSEDIKTIDATVLVISQIGELVKNFDKDFQQKYTTIKWHILKGVRNRIVHDYEGINLKVVWFIITNDLQPLKNDLQKIIDNQQGTTIE